MIQQSERISSIKGKYTWGGDTLVFKRYSIEGKGETITKDEKNETIQEKAESGKEEKEMKRYNRERIYRTLVSHGLDESV